MQQDASAPYPRDAENVVVVDFFKESPADERWIEGDDGFPGYLNPSLEGVESEWIELDHQQDDLYWRRGALAHAISENRVYGEGNIKQFCGRMNVDESTVHDWLSTYRRLLLLSPERRGRVVSLDLRYGHYRAVNGVKDDIVYEELLRRAADGKWYVGRLRDAVHAWRNSLYDEDEGNPPEPPAAEPDQDGPPKPERDEPDPKLKARAYLTAFLEWARDEQGYVLTSPIEDYAVADIGEFVEDFLDSEG